MQSSLLGKWLSCRFQKDGKDQKVHLVSVNKFYKVKCPIENSENRMWNSFFNKEVIKGDTFLGLNLFCPDKRKVCRTRINVKFYRR